jgi:hypothetical protein
LGYSSDVHGAKKISVRRIYDYETHDPKFESLLGYEIFIFSKTSRLALGPTQPPIQWVPRFCHGGKAARA